MRAKAVQPVSGQRELLQAKVLQPLRDSYDTLTKTEKKIASYFLSRPDCLVLETAATIAGNVGVSPMTVGRFLRLTLAGRRWRINPQVPTPTITRAAEADVGTVATKTLFHKVSRSRIQCLLR